MISKNMTSVIAMRTRGGVVVIVSKFLKVSIGSKWTIFIKELWLTDKIIVSFVGLRNEKVKGCA